MVKNPSYQSYFNADEKGYWVTFENVNEKFQPKFVIINKIKQKVSPSDAKGNQYKVNVLVESRRFEGYQGVVSDLPNGIIYQVDGQEKHQSIDFKMLK